MHLSRCVFALGVLGAAGAPAWTQEWLRRSMGKFDEYKPVDFAMTMKGLAMSGISPEKDWLEAMYLHSGSKLGKFKAMERVNMLHDIAVSGFSPDRRWMQRWFAADPDVLDAYNARDSSLFLHAVALTDMDVPEVWFDRFKARLPAMTAPKDKHRAHLFNAWAAVSGKAAMRVPVRITDADRIFYRGKRAGLSGLEREVLNILRQRVREQDILQQYWLDEILSAVDFYIMQARLVIQADGPFHYLAKGELNPQSRLQTKILEGLGYRVRRVSYIAWNKPGGKESFLGEIERDLAGADAADPIVL